MIDIEKLKALAEAAKEDWCNWWTIQQLENRAVDGAGAELIVAANPAAVLELIAELKSLRVGNADLRTANKSLRGSCEAVGKEFKKAKRERNVARLQRDLQQDLAQKRGSELDQLKAENEAFMKFMAEISQDSGDNYAVMRARQFLKVPGYE